MTSWDFYSKFLHYNSFVYAKMYGKINCRFYKKGGRYMNELLERYVDRYVREREINVYITACLEIGVTKETTIDQIMKKFDLTEEDAEEYYDEAIQQ